VSSTALARYSVALFAAVVVQQVVLDRLEMFGAHPDLMILLPVASGWLGGAGWGAATGFTAGMLADLFASTPFGLSAFVGTVVGYAVGMSAEDIPRDAPALFVAVSALATSAYLVAYAILGAVFGQPGVLKVDLLPAVLVAAPSSLVLAIPVMKLAAWGLSPARDRRPASRTARR
jgi:rod shape-determining protein MreD